MRLRGYLYLGDRMYLTDLADACRKSGLNVVERPGWKTRGHGEMYGVRTIACHHTAGRATGEAPTLDYIERNGLSQLVLGRSATVYVVAAGVCWHAGVVSNTNYTNRWAIGIEAEATGVDLWPSEQYNAYARLCSALTLHYGLDIDDVRGHKEIAYPAGRKIDPNFDMPAFRRLIADMRTPVPPPPPPPTNVVTLKKGMRHPDVWVLQRILTTRYPSYSKWTPTGYFGDKTEESVKEFQRRSRLTADGIVGPITRRALRM